MIPPIRHTITASTRNCWRISDCRAPTAMRIPISRVRSVTDTSMIFITPIPPTNKEITAINDSNSARERLVFCTVCMMLSRLLVKKSLVPWRCSMSLLTLSSTTLLGWPSLMRTVMLSR